MRDRALAVLLTLAVFSAGLAAGLWAERHRPLPPPPGSLMGEFSGRSGPSGTKPHDHPAHPPINRAELSEQLARLKPEIEAFAARISEIYSQFDRDMDTVLTPEQRIQYEKRFRAHRNAPEIPSSGPISDEQIDQLEQRPFRTLAYFVVIPMTLERLTNDLKLDDLQRGKVRDLLRVRREKFIELMDTSPPPSLALSRLAPVAERLAVPAGGPAPAR